MNPEGIVKQTEMKMGQTVDHLIGDLKYKRTGRANPTLIDSLMVDYYGTLTPLQQLSNITVPDAKLLLVQPYDQNSINDIEKSISNSDLGLNPSNDGEVIRIPIPPLSEERRLELGKVASKTAEESKVAIRNHRRNSMADIDSVKNDFSEDEVKRFEKEIQDITDKYISKIDGISYNFESGKYFCDNKFHFFHH